MQEALQVIRSTEKYGQAIQLSPSSVDEFALVSGQKFGLSGWEEEVPWQISHN